MTDRRRRVGVPPMEESKRRFLEALSKGASVHAAACEAEVSFRTMYAYRAKDPEFEQAWKDAWEAGVDILEDEATRRAMDGSDSLLIFMLKGKRAYRYRETNREPEDGDAEGKHMNDLELAHKLVGILGQLPATAPSPPPAPAPAVVQGDPSRTVPMDYFIGIAGGLLVGLEVNAEASYDASADGLKLTSPDGWDAMVPWETFVESDAHGRKRLIEGAVASVRNG